MCLLAAYGFLWLKGNFSLPPLFVGGHALGFCNVPRYDFDCNRPYINKDDLICYSSRNWSETHFTFSFHPGCDPHQFAYRTKTTTMDTVSTDLPAATSHLEQGRNRTQLFIIDLSSAFNTVLPNRLVSKLPELGISDSVCLWIRDFLTDRSWRVRIDLHVTPFSHCSLEGIMWRELPGSRSSTVEALLKKEHPLWHIRVKPCIITHDPTVVKLSD